MASKIGMMILVLSVATCFAQSNLLQITSPPSGTVVYPNQIVTVSVNADPSVSDVAILGQYPLGFTQTTNGQPLQFQLTIPSSAPIGAYDVSAIGSESDGSFVASPPISLQLDTQTSALLNGTEPSVLRFDSAGEAMPLRVTGLLPDGSQLDITHSVQMSYSSQNPQIATVDGQGIVTAVALGSTYIVVSNSSSTYLVNTRVGQLAIMSFLGLASTIPGTSITFQWTGSNPAQAYWIDVGSTPGGNNYDQSGSLPTTTLSRTVTGLPTDGSTIYVTLWTQINGQWAYNQYTYLAFNTVGGIGAVQTPAPGSVLSGNSVTFTWSAGSGASAYWLDVGNTPGANDIYQSGNLGNVLSTTVNTLPANGSQVYVTLWSLVSGQWFNNQYTYTSGP